MSSQTEDINLEEETPGVAAHPLQPFFNVLAALGTVWIFGLMLLVVADVLGRNFLNMPITGVAEFAAHSVSTIVFLQLAAAIGAGKMTRSDFLLRMVLRWSPRAVVALEVFFTALAALVFLVLTYIAWPEWMRAWDSNEFFGVQGVFTIPTWPFRGVIVMGAAMAALAYILCIPALLRNPPLATGVSL